MTELDEELAELRRDKEDLQRKLTLQKYALENSKVFFRALKQIIPEIEYEWQYLEAIRAMKQENDLLHKQIVSWKEEEKDWKVCESEIYKQLQEH